MTDKTSKLNSQNDPVNYEDPSNVSEFLQEKSPLKRDNDGAIMLDTGASDDDTVSSSKRVRQHILKWRKRLLMCESHYFVQTTKIK